MATLEMVIPMWYHTSVAVNWERFARGLKDRREGAVLTQAALAGLVGVERNTIARLETGNRRPSIDLLERLAGALRCRVRDLLPEGGKK